MQTNAFDLISVIRVLRTTELPSVPDLLLALQQCRREKNVRVAKLLHTLLCEHGLEVRAVLGNRLVRAFVESNELAVAELVFERLCDRNEDSWTSFMHGCIDHGHATHAFKLHKTMQANGYPAASIDLLRTLLKACAALRDTVSGHFCHLDIVKLGFETDTFISSGLIDMYAKSGPIDSALLIFDRLQHRDVVLWTVVVSGLVQHGLVNDSIKCVDDMQAEGVSPNAVTFCCILKGLRSKSCFKRIHQAHKEVVKRGFDKALCVESTLVDVYAKCGDIIEAEKIFQSLATRDVILWTALIAAYADRGLEDTTIDCLNEMEMEGVLPNFVTYICSLKAFGDSASRNSVYEIHTHLVIRGFEDNPLVGGSLVSTYGRCRALDDAQDVLDGLSVQDEYSCNSLLSALTEQGLCDHALQYVDKMQVQGVSYNAFTYVCSLRACCCQKLMEKGLKLHAEIVKDEFELDPYVVCALVDMYSKCEFFAEAWAVIKESSVQSSASWTALITGYLENGYFTEALACLRSMQDSHVTLDAVTYVCGLKACTGSRMLEAGQQLHDELVKDGFEVESSVGNTLVDMYAKSGLLSEAEDVFNELLIQQLVSWTALMSGYVELKHFEKALELYERVPLEKLTADSIIFLSILKACSNLGALDKGQLIHSDIAKEGFEEDPAISSSLVDMYAKCGRLVEALEVLDEMTVQNTVLWTAVITGFTCQGNSRAVFGMLHRFIKEGLEPDVVTFLNLLTVCSHDGLVNEGFLLLDALSKALTIIPSIELFNCLMDLVSRASRLSEAFVVVEEMPFHPNQVAWNTILGGCQKWRCVPLGELAFQCALMLDCKQPAPYTSMISIYADACMWKDAKRIDSLREAACCND